MKTPEQIALELEKMKLNAYETMRSAFLISNPEATGFSSIDSYRDFIKREDVRQEKFLRAYERQLDRLETKLGKPCTQITKEEYEAN